MKIGIDVRTACSRKAGKGVYTYELVRHLLALDRANEYVLYTDSISADFAAFHHAHIKVIHARKWAWHFAVIKDWTRREKGDVFFAPTSFIIPALLPARYASVVTVHDIVAFLYPQLHQGKATILERIFLKIALKKTRGILVPSPNTKDDLMNHFTFMSKQNLANKVHVTPLAADEIFFKKSGDLEAVRKKYQLPKEFILTVSGLEPRKNISELLDAFEAVSEKNPNTYLVIVGSKGWKSAALQQRIALLSRGPAPKILHLENISFGDLPALYQLATIFVFPSLYEGFGLPPLEAMASGVPVVSSDAGSLKEVVGDAALTFTPGQTSALAHHMETLLNDPSLRTELIQKGHLRAKQFSWETSAHTTLKVLRNLTT